MKMWESPRCTFTIPPSGWHCLEEDHTAFSWYKYFNINIFSETLHITNPFSSIWRQELEQVRAHLAFLWHSP